MKRMLSRSALTITAVLVLAWSGLGAFAPTRRLGMLVAGLNNTHESITTDALLQLLQSKTFLNVTKVTPRMHAAIQTIVDANAKVDKDQYHSRLHFDGENFDEGQERLTSLSDDIVNAMIADNTHDARVSLGSALHSIQDFYSHSNWVELGNSDIHPTLGQRAAGRFSVYPIARLSATTCDGNLLTDPAVLTSGYYHGEDQPLLPHKCRHGGPLDGFFGINKDFMDVVWSPHSSHHQTAADLANSATQQFVRIIDERIGRAATKRLLGVGQTMAFTVDVSLGMDETLPSLKTLIRQLVDGRQSSAEPPSTYLLTTFYGDHLNQSRTSTTVANDPAKFVLAVDGMAIGNAEYADHDEPTPSMSGLLATLNAMDDPGDVVLFTNASITYEDCPLTTPVQRLAHQKKIKLHLFVPPGFDTHNCVKPSLQDENSYTINLQSQRAGRLPESTTTPSSASTWSEFASYSGGQAIVWSGDPAGLSSTVNRVTSGTVDLLSVTDSIDVDRSYDVIIDPSLTSVTISITGAPGATLSRPNGTTVTSADTDVGTTSTAGTVIRVITSPTPGTWGVSVPAGSHFSLTVSAEGATGQPRLRYLGLAGRPGHAGYMALDGPPNANQSATAVIQFDEPFVSAELQFRRPNNATIGSVTLAAAGGSEFGASVTIPATWFRPYVVARDAMGARYERVLAAVAFPQAVEFGLPGAVTLTPGETTTVPITFTNRGTATQFVLMTESARRLPGASHYVKVDLGPDQSHTVNLEIRTPENAARDTIDTIRLKVVDYKANTADVASIRATVCCGQVTSAPAELRLAATMSGTIVRSVTPAQIVSVGFTGERMAWAATADQPWLQLSNSTGTGAGQFTVKVINPDQVLTSVTEAAASITITSGGRTTTIPVTLTVRPVASSTPPIGSFDTPVEHSFFPPTLSGSIPVTGWALDDVGIERVEIWRDRVAGETTPVYPGPGPGTGKVYIADAFFVTGARPDVATIYSGLPLASRAGWGYLMLTHGLWNQGNGRFTFYAFAYDTDGNSSILGSKTVPVGNSQATLPFGSIDVPSYGQTVTSNFWNFGWALTPNAGCAVAGGGAWVSIDSGPLQRVDYGARREDIAAAFPGYSDGSGAGGAFYVDISTLSNGTHQIGWFVEDSCGRPDGIGSRFFNVLNTGTRASALPAPWRDSRSSLTGAAVDVIRNGVVETVAPDPSGVRVIQIGQEERVEVRLPFAEGGYSGYQLVGDSRSALPLGSSLDETERIFYWQPATGFLGSHELVFVPRNESGVIRLRAVVATDVQAVIDVPEAGEVSASFLIAGWAIEQASAEGTGIDGVHIWAHPVSGQPPTFLGLATYGGVRPDVGALFGDRFAPSSFGLTVNHLRPGTYDIVAYPHSTVAGFHGAKAVRVTVRQ